MKEKIQKKEWKKTHEKLNLAFDFNLIIILSGKHEQHIYMEEIDWNIKIERSKVFFKSNHAS